MTVGMCGCPSLYVCVCLGRSTDGGVQEMGGGTGETTTGKHFSLSCWMSVYVGLRLTLFTCLSVRPSVRSSISDRSISVHFPFPSDCNLFQMIVTITDG